VVPPESEVKGIGITLLSRSVSTVREITETIGTLSNQFQRLKLTILDFSEKHLFDRDTYIALLDLETWLSSDEFILKELRTGGFTGAVVVLTSRGLGNPEMAKLSSEKVFFFDRTLDSRALPSLIRKLLEDAMIVARKHRRHITDEVAELQIPGRTELITCRVRNLSSGGAYLEFDSPLPIIKGDEVLIRIRLSKLARVYSVRSRVAWVTKSGMGIQFLESKV
jgi:hypothetical protein